MRKIIDYTVVKAPTSEALTQMVLTMMVDDWQPIGGVCTGGVDRSNHLQAIVKYEDHEL